MLSTFDPSNRVTFQLFHANTQYPTTENAQVRNRGFYRPQSEQVGSWQRSSFTLTP